MGLEMNLFRSSSAEECCFLWLLPSCPPSFANPVYHINPTSSHAIIVFIITRQYYFSASNTGSPSKKKIITNTERKESILVVEPSTFPSALMKRGLWTRAAFSVDLECFGAILNIFIFELRSTQAGNWLCDVTRVVHT